MVSSRRKRVDLRSNARHVRMVQHSIDAFFFHLSDSTASFEEAWYNVNGCLDLYVAQDLDCKRKLHITPY